EEFEGYITGVSAYGLHIELIEHFVEGMVHISTMADDYYRYSERAHTLRGESSGRVYRLGDRVRVQVIRVDLERRQIDLGLSESLEAVAAREGKGAKRRRTRPKTEVRKPKTEVRKPKVAGRPGRRE